MRISNNELVWVLTKTGTIIEDKVAYKNEHPDATFEQVTSAAAKSRVNKIKLVWVLTETGTIIEDKVAYKNEHPDATFEQITSAEATKRASNNKVWVLTETGTQIKDPVAYKNKHPEATFEQITINAAKLRVSNNKLVWVLTKTGTKIKDPVAYKNEHPDATFEHISVTAAKARVSSNKLVWVLKKTGTRIEDKVAYKKEHPNATFEQITVSAARSRTRRLETKESKKIISTLYNHIGLEDSDQVAEPKKKKARKDVTKDLTAKKILENSPVDNQNQLNMDELKNTRKKRKKDLHNVPQNSSKRRKIENDLNQIYVEHIVEEKCITQVQTETDVVKVKKEFGIEQFERLPIVDFNWNKFREIAKRLRGERNHDDDATDCAYLAEAFLEYLCTGKEPTGPIPKQSMSCEHFSHYPYSEKMLAQVKQEPGLKPKKMKSAKVAQLTRIDIDRNSKLGKRAPLGKHYVVKDGCIDVDSPIYDIERFKQPSALYSELNECLIKEAELNGGRLCGMIDIGRCGKSVYEAIHLFVFVVETQPVIKIAFIDPQQPDDDYLVVDDLTQIIPFYNPMEEQTDPASERVFYSPVTTWCKEENNANSTTIETEPMPAASQFQQTDELMETEDRSQASINCFSTFHSQSQQLPNVFPFYRNPSPHHFYTSPNLINFPPNENTVLAALPQDEEEFLIRL
jgi:hypothetical protein